jgi:hypothetical protein
MACAIALFLNNCCCMWRDLRNVRFNRFASRTDNDANFCGIEM